MKLLVLTTLLIASPALAANTSSTSVVREYARNTGGQDWVLDKGWVWNAGVLTHIVNSAPGEAHQAAMPPLTAGRLYRIDATLTGRTNGRITVSLGNEYSAWYAGNGSYTTFVIPTDPSTLLSFYATTAFDGSVSDVRVVELGPNLVPAGAASAVFDSAQPLTRSLDLTPGRTYQVEFDVTRNAQPGTGRAGVSLGGSAISVSQDGWYRFDMEAQAGLLVFTTDATAQFTGAIESLSVREVTSDAVSASAPARNR